MLTLQTCMCQWSTTFLPLQKQRGSLIFNTELTAGRVGHVDVSAFRHRSCTLSNRTMSDQDRGERIVTYNVSAGDRRAAELQPVPSGPVDEITELWRDTHTRLAVPRHQ